MSTLGRWSAIAAVTLGLVTVATWNQGDRSAATPAAIGGAQLFRAKGCASCHDGPDSPTSFGSGFPSLAEAPTWAGDRRPDLSAADYLTESIAAPGVFISPEFTPGQSGPTTGMPRLELTGEEIDALVAYLLGR